MRFCFDINDIKSVGIKKWSNYFSWPVSFEEFQQLYTKIWQGFEYVLDTEEEDITDVVEICCKLAFHFASVAHLQIVSDRIKGKGYEYDIENVLSNKLLEIRKFWALDHQLNAEPVKNWLRTLKHSFISDLSLGIYPSGGFVNSIGGFSSLKRAYLRENKQFMIYRRPESIVGKLNSSDYFSMFRPRIKTAVDTLIVKIRENLAGVNIQLPDRLFEDFRSIALSAYLLSGALYEQVKKNMSRKKQRILLGMGLGNAVHRSILIANSRIGGYSIGSSHGGYVWLHAVPFNQRLELSCVDEFLMPTEGAKNSLLKMIKRSDILRTLKTRITSVNDDTFKRHFIRNRSEPIPSKIQKVMYIGFPYTGDRYLENPECFTPVQVDLENRVLSLLKDRYYVIYKAHPDNLAESDSGMVWADLADKIETGRFEDVYDEADAIIFGTTGTTTFSFSLPTKKRLIFFDTGHELFEGEVKKRLLKRAIAIRAWFDDRNRLMFDEDQLLDALAIKPEEPDMEIVEQYMLP